MESTEYSVLIIELSVEYLVYEDIEKRFLRPTGLGVMRLSAGCRAVRRLLCPFRVYVSGFDDRRDDQCVAQYISGRVEQIDRVFNRTVPIGIFINQCQQYCLRMEWIMDLMDKPLDTTIQYRILFLGLHYIGIGSQELNHLFNDFMWVVISIWNIRRKLIVFNTILVFESGIKTLETLPEN